MKYPIILFAVSIILAVPSCDKTGSGEGADDSTKSVARDSMQSDIPAELERGTDTLRLAMRFVKGETFGYRISTRQNVVTLLDTVENKSLQSTAYSYRFDVVETYPDGSARLKATCLNVQFAGDYSAEGSKSSMKYDSDDKNEAAKEKTFAQYNAPVNTPFTVMISKDGRISEVEDYERILQRLLGDDYGRVAKAAKDQLGRSYAEDGLKNIVQLAFQKFEDKSVGVDSSWKHTWSGNVGFLKIRNDATYILKGFRDSEEKPQGKLAYIEGKLTSTYVGPKVLDTGEGNATLEKFQVRGVGSTVFDLTYGKTVSRTMRQTLQTIFLVELPAELKQQAPNNGKRDYRWSQRAEVENSVQRLPR